ncbi:MAG: PadR family transcriptional regulator [Bacteroidetes bacterium]|nr:PadR family transcriptional regulator [Bacteroidota bacterium]MCB0846407.1 PadR family transcriptional regulator [Bacteroidota bacterium]
MTSNKIGEFEELVLLAVCILEDNAYGVSVKREIEKHSHRSILLGAAHSTLYRLQDKGYLTSALAGQSAKRGDRRKRIFQITASGMAALKEAQLIRQKMWSLIPDLKLG